MTSNGPSLAWDAICRASCHWWALEQLFADALPKVSKENTKQKNHAMRMKSKHQVLTTFSSVWNTQTSQSKQLLNLCFLNLEIIIMWAMDEITCLGETAITKCGLSPISFAGVEYGIWTMWYGWVVRCRLWRFPEPLQSSRQLLAHVMFLFIWDPASHHTLDGLCEVLHTAMRWWVLSLLHPTKYD